VYVRDDGRVLHAALSKFDGAEPVRYVPVAEVERLREALRWYADENNWLDGAAGEWIVEPGHPGSYDGFTHDEFEHDNGEKARAALEQRP
jgi:hypothetical protein